MTLSRRQFLGGTAAVAGVAATGGLARLAVAAPSEPDLVAVVEPVHAVYDPSAHRWAMALDATTCIGCLRCEDACRTENGVPDEAGFARTWVELNVVDAEGNTFAGHPDGEIPGLDAEAEALLASDPRHAFFVPRLCMQCQDSPCTKICPVSATYTTPDGVTLVDAERCIGCGYCVVACPYGARYIVPDTGSRPAQPGVADKCTFCYHRITRGLKPACVEVCPTQARVFGDLNDEASPVTVFLRERRTTVMKPELGTDPRVFYAGLETEVPVR